MVKELNLIPTGMRNISTPSGEREVSTYLVKVVLPNGVDIGQIEVCETEIGNQGIALLVGMDVITRGDLSISNFNGRTVFTFSIPSMKTTDFAKAIKIANALGSKQSRRVPSKKKR